jgi:hypothetical protein
MAVSLLYTIGDPDHAGLRVYAISLSLRLFLPASQGPVRSKAPLSAPVSIDKTSDDNFLANIHAPSFASDQDLDHFD